MKKEENPFSNSDNEIIRAIAIHDVEFLKNKINYKNTFHKLRDDCFEEIYQYDFSWFFNNSSCIFCENSFEVKKDKKDGKYKYFCKCYHVPLNILIIIERIGRFKNRVKTIKFILNIFNMNYDEIATEKYFKDLETKYIKELNNKKFKKTK